MVFNRRGSHNITDPRHVCSQAGHAGDAVILRNSTPHAYHSLDEPNHLHHQNQINRIPRHSDNSFTNRTNISSVSMMGEGIVNISLDISSEEDAVFYEANSAISSSCSENDNLGIITSSNDNQNDYQNDYQKNMKQTCSSKGFAEQV